MIKRYSSSKLVEDFINFSKMDFWSVTSKEKESERGEKECELRSSGEGDLATDRSRAHGSESRRRRRSEEGKGRRRLEKGREETYSQAPYVSKTGRRVRLLARTRDNGFGPNGPKSAADRGGEEISFFFFLRTLKSLLFFLLCLHMTNYT
jgi:hypothetical protein